MDAPTPKDVSELRSFPNLSSTLSPLYLLLQEKTPWSWGPLQKETFEEAKKLLATPRVLVHYDARKKLVVACDASPNGLGAVLSHEMDDGSEHPICLALLMLYKSKTGLPEILYSPRSNCTFNKDGQLPKQMLIFLHFFEGRTNSAS